MKNFYAYVVRDAEGRILDPDFVMGKLEPVVLKEKEELLTGTIHDFMKFIHETPEDAELTITWYIRACELNEETPKKLHVEKLQLTVLFREV